MGPFSPDLSLHSPKPCMQPGMEMYYLILIGPHLWPKGMGDYWNESIQSHQPIKQQDHTQPQRAS
jgi:hypothetical protein